MTARPRLVVITQTDALSRFIRAPFLVILKSDSARLPDLRTLANLPAMRSIVILVLACTSGFLMARWFSPLCVELPLVGAPKVAPILQPKPVAAEPRAVPVFRPLRDEIAILPAVKRLMSVLDSRDIPRTAKYLMEAIGELSAEDFRALQSGKANMPHVSAYGFDNGFTAAFARSFVERWLAVDEAGALAALPDLAKKAHGAGQFERGPLLLALIAAKPKEALRILVALEPDDMFGPISSAVKMTFARLAALEPFQARNFLADCRDANQRRVAEIGIALGIAENDPSSGAALAEQLGTSEIFTVALASAQKSGANAVLEVAMKAKRTWLSTHRLNGLVMQYPGAAWENIPDDPNDKENKGGIGSDVLNAARLLAPETRQRLLQRTLTFPAFMRGELQAALLENWVADAPQDAAQWVLKNAVPEKKDDAMALQFMYGTWLRQDREAALAWRESLPPGPAREHIAELHRVYPATGTKLNIAEEAQYMVELDNFSALDSTMQTWLAKDADAAAKWTQDLADAVQKDRARRAYALAVAQKDTAIAREWAESVVIPRIREQAAKGVLPFLQRENPAVARAWIQGLQGVHPLWKQWMQKDSR